MTSQKRVKRQSSKPILGWLQKKLGGSARTPRAPAEERARASTLQQLEIPPRFSENQHVILNDDDVSHIGRSTPARSSRSSTRSPPEADDDASIRPLPPTSPPSPTPSRSSSSYLSDPRTFKSVTASTKPTTLISIDLGTNGMAHIAQAPPTPTSMSNTHPGYPRLSTSSINVPTSTSITFSALPPTTPVPRAEYLPSNPGTVQAPLHTAHHPRYNPRPSSPPLDNASVLTLASSAYAFPGGRMGGWVGDSQSQFALDSNSQHGGELEVDEGQVEDASVRALRPRSSRRGSWESEASGWSARVAIIRERSLKSSSWKAGTLTDGDNPTELIGEEPESSEAKPVHGPSPLAVTGFTSADVIPIPTDEEGMTPPATDTSEIKFVVPVQEETGPFLPAPEVERTPTKTLLAGTDKDDEQDEDLTHKFPKGVHSSPVVKARESDVEMQADA